MIVYVTGQSSVSNLGLQPWGGGGGGDHLPDMRENSHYSQNCLIGKYRKEVYYYCQKDMT